VNEDQLGGLLLFPVHRNFELVVELVPISGALLPEGGQSANEGHEGSDHGDDGSDSGQDGAHWWGDVDGNTSVVLVDAVAREANHRCKGQEC